VWAGAVAVARLLLVLVLGWICPQVFFGVFWGCWGGGECLGVARPVRFGGCLGVGRVGVRVVSPLHCECSVSRKGVGAEGGLGMAPTAWRSARCWDVGARRASPVDEERCSSVMQQGGDVRGALQLVRSRAAVLQVVAPGVRCRGDVDLSTPGATAVLTCGDVRGGVAPWRVTVGDVAPADHDGWCCTAVIDSVVCPFHRSSRSGCAVCPFHSPVVAGCRSAAGGVAQLRLAPPSARSTGLLESASPHPRSTWSSGVRCCRPGYPGLPVTATRRKRQMKPPEIYAIGRHGRSIRTPSRCCLDFKGDGGRSNHVPRVLRPVQRQQGDRT
jgi:hypothetical protein